MFRSNFDEYHFDPGTEQTDRPEEYRYADEYPDAGTANAASPADGELAPEFECDAPDRPREAAREDSSTRHDRIKKLMLLPIACAVATASITLASFNIDPLGRDFLAESESVSSLAPGPSDETSSVPEDPSSGTESSSSESGIDFTDSFPTLPNLEPDFAGEYAWSGMGSEEYVIVDGHYLHAGTIYTELSGVVLESLPGAVYNKAPNMLTLNNYHGTHADFNLMGNGFKIELIGDNSFDSIQSWGAMYGGSITFTGSGSIRINEKGEASGGVGLMFQGEDSPSCLMIDRDATVEVWGENAIMIQWTTLDRAIYTLNPIVMTGGGNSTAELAEYAGTLTDDEGNPVLDDSGNPITQITVAGPDGKPATHVLFAPGTV